MRKLRFALCLALICLITTETLTAVPPRVGTLSEEISSGNIQQVSSRMKVAPELTNEETAVRLYYLGIMSGVGIKNGTIDFALETPLTRLESIVLATRMLGVESDVLQKNYAHPFPDVPEWGSPYVGYFWEHGMLYAGSNPVFGPTAAVSTDDFMRFMFFALGYDEGSGGYSSENVAYFASVAGICTETKASITRGDAAQYIYRTLNTTCAGSDRMLSEYFVESEQIGYKDALFLLWSENKAESDAYITENGYTVEKILPDGKYTVVLQNSTRCLNVAVDGGNSDYEGVSVTVWKRTGDISQKFRLERTSRGTYHVYSCASSGGFNRMLGIGSRGTGGLYSGNSTYAGEYYIRYYNKNDGGWQMISAADPTRVLGSSDKRNGAAIQLCSPDDPAFKTTWTFEFDGVFNDEGYEFALYPSDTLYITQGAYDCYSHQKQNALDLTTSNGSVYAPFTGRIARIDRGYNRYNTVWLESCDKVVYADGTIDYMTVVFMHDNNVADLSVGQIVAQGEYFYDMGVAGGATGPHVHIAVLRGQYKKGSSLTGSGNVYVEDALFLSADTRVLGSYGLDWVYMIP